MTEGKKNVVIFEDNSSIGQLLKFFFMKRGYETNIYEDGMNAVANIQAHNPVLIMMDVIMPGKDGIAACSDVREAGIKTPILMLTSKSFAADLDRALAAGASAYLLKPFNPADLEATISTLLA